MLESGYDVEADRVRLRVELSEDRMVKLPAEVPVGPAEIIVLVEVPTTAPRAGTSLLGLIADEPEVVDEAMAYVRSQRRDRRVGPHPR